jgi:hypothetical protein
MTREEAIALLTERVGHGEQVIMFLASREDYAGVLSGEDDWDYDVPRRVWDAVASRPLIGSHYSDEECVISLPAYSQFCEDIEDSLKAAWVKWVDEKNTER